MPSLTKPEKEDIFTMVSEETEIMLSLMIAT